MCSDLNLAKATVGKLRAALAIASVIDMVPNGGALHGVLDDGNVTGDLSFDQSVVNRIRSDGFRDGGWQMKPEQFQVYQECLDALLSLPDEAREHAYELFERAYGCYRGDFDGYADE